MSDNRLLTENTIRRFMKLANVETLTDNFIAETAGGATIAKDAEKAREDAQKNLTRRPMTKRDSQKQEESVEEEDTLEENEEEVDLEENLEDLEEQEEDEEMEIDAELDADMDAEPMDAEPEMGAADMSLTEEEAQLLISLGERLSAAMEGAGAEDAAVDDAPAMDDMDDMEGMDSPEGEEEPPGMGGAYRQEENIDQEELVNEVLKRVTKRLVAAKLKNRK